MSDSYYNGDITVTNSGAFDGRVGGLLAYSDSAFTISNCYANVDMAINSAGNPAGYIGGGVGIAGSGAGGNNISNCYVTGTIQNNGGTALTSSAFGGFIGNSFNITISNCHTSFGPWSGVTGNREGFLGRIGGGSTTVTNCYWNSTVAGHATATTEGTPLTTNQYSKESNFKSWDFTNTWYIGTNGILMPLLQLKLHNPSFQDPLVLES